MENTDNKILDDNISDDKSDSKDIAMTLEETILALVTGIEKESDERNAKLLGDLLDAYCANDRLYECEITMAFLNFTRFASMPYKSCHKILDKKNAAIIDYMYNGMFDHYLRRYIEKNEGHVCSGDKVHFVTEMVKKAIETGENQSLYRTYEGCDRIPKEDWDKQSYWSPKTLKDTDTVIKMFWDWYNVN